MALNINLQKILNTRGKKDEENSMLIDQFFSLTLRKLADIQIKLLGNSRITPNQITITRAVIFLPLIFFSFAHGSYLGNILGIVFSYLNTVFDILDGSLARAKALSSEIGGWLDRSLDKMMVYLIFIGIAIGAYRQSGDPVMLIVGIAVIFLHTLLVFIANDFEHVFGPDLYFDVSLARAAEKKGSRFEKIVIHMFVFESFWSYSLFAVRYQVFLGAILNILPLMMYYWIIVFTVRWLFLCFVYYSIFKSDRSSFVFINILRNRAQHKK